MEPYRVKMVEPIYFTTREQRAQLLAAAGYNLFRLRARDVMVDLLTDSGVGAMSQAQWGALMQGDESYAGASSFYRFEAAVQRLTGNRHVVPVHQGRAAEALLFGALDVGGTTIPNNTHFDTTRANAARLGARPLDLPCAEAGDLRSAFGFKGNVDLEQLKHLLDSDPGVPCVLVTITNNAAGGQPVALDNLAAVRDLCQQHCTPLFLDACRFAENAFLARQRTPSLHGRSLEEVARAYFDLADGCLMSAKKNAMSNCGGFLALNDGSLAEHLRAAMVMTEGFPTYGGLSGRDLEAIAVGLEEGLDEDYLAHRTGQIAWLAGALEGIGVPVVHPSGGHAVFVDAGRFLPHLPRERFPGQAVACALYLEGGVRSVEVGTFMMEAAAQHELVRLCIPHRVYSREQLERVVEAMAVVAGQRERLAGYRVVQAPRFLRHFTATLAPCDGELPQPPLEGAASPNTYQTVQ